MEFLTNKHHRNLYKQLVKSYYEGNFDEEFDRILNHTEYKREATLKLISALCNQEIDINAPDNEVKTQVIYAITNYKVKEKIAKQLISNSNLDSEVKENCKSLCPLNSILDDPISCDTILQTKACVDCGLCDVQVQLKGLFDSDSLLPVAELLDGEEDVIAIVAPAIAGQFGDDVTLDHMRTAFIHLGFSDMIEVALGADILTIKEAVEFDRHVSHKDDLLITSCCCPMWVGMIRKVYGEFVKDVSPSVSPMIAMGRIIKKFKPDSKVVFVGPCAAKKSEARDPELAGVIDYVLTFQEIQEMLNIQNINPSELNPIISMDYASKGGRLYGKTSGVSQAVAEAIEELFPEKYDIFKPIQANGVKECKEMLANLREGKINATFVEGMGCAGGCVGGPKSIIPVEKATELLTRTANESAVKVTVNSDVMKQMLKKLDINGFDDFMEPEKIKILERKFEG